MSDEKNIYQVSSEELLQLIEQYEAQEIEKKAAAERQKEIMAEAKSRGYDVKAIRTIISLRAKDKDTVAEEEAILDTYKIALGMD